jgi:hypothetical protein
MFDPVDALILDLLEWIGPGSRPYSEVIEAWRTSCPRLPVWEEANSRGFIDHEHRDGIGGFVSVSTSGRAFLTEQRRRHQIPG